MDSLNEMFMLAAENELLGVDGALDDMLERWNAQGFRNGNQEAFLAHGMAKLWLESQRKHG